jgi:hypothetical protein
MSPLDTREMFPIKIGCISPKMWERIGITNHFFKSDVNTNIRNKLLQMLPTLNCQVEYMGPDVLVRDQSLSTLHPSF